MRCFAGAFPPCPRGLGASGDAGGSGRFGRTESRSLGDAILRQANVDIPSARGSRALGDVVVGSRLARAHLETPESARL